MDDIKMLWAIQSCGCLLAAVLFSFEQSEEKKKQIPT